VLKEKLGIDATENVEAIKKIIACDCNCNPELITSQALPGVGGSTPLQIQGAGGTIVTSEVAGSTLNYTVSSKVVQVTKDADDLNFTISKSESQYGVVYDIAFNYSKLSETILNTIASDAELTNLIKLIVGATGAGIDLGGLNSTCVISIGNCSYLLVEPNNALKNIISITIDGVVFNAPSSLSLSSTSAISTWLNSLNKGNFVVSFDSGSNSVSISSSANISVVTSFVMTSGGTTINRLFSRSCVGLVEFLNAITSYICDLDASKIKLGLANKKLCTLNQAGEPIQIPLSANQPLSEIVSGLLDAQCLLISRLNSVAISCSSMKALFTSSSAPIQPTDGLYGTKSSNCAIIPFPELAQVLLNQVGASPALQSALCALVANCTTSPCAGPTNVSGLYEAGANCAPVTNINATVTA
jgi:hypothetical protein